MIARLDIHLGIDDGSGMRIAMASTLLLMLVACGKPNPAARNEVLAEGDAWNRVVLDAGERERAVTIMKDAARVPDPVYPTPAARGVRWSDVPGAASRAAGEVEMAVVRGANPGTPDWDAGFLAKPPASLVGDASDRRERWVFELKTLRDERGWLVVVRDPAAPPGEIGPTIAAIGVLGQRTADEKTLVDAFKRQLRTLGAKPGFETD